MSRFSVWAPHAERVDLVLADGRVAMGPMAPVGTGADVGSHGWWVVDVDVAVGADYAFSLDGGPPRPDPRSRHQPDGVHGPSRLVGAPTVTRGPWSGFDLATAVLYELHVGTFTPEGTFDAAIGRLDHLVSLGVTAVELMPVSAFDGEWGWGYDGVDLWAVHEPYGGPAGLARFVEACHGRGLGVMLDVVYNHLGPVGNYLGEFGPYFTDGHRTPWGWAVNLDGPGSDEVRAFVVDNALMWLTDYGIDGLRLDATHELHDESAIHILEELSARVDDLSTAEGRPRWVVAESDRNDPRLVTGRDEGGFGLHAVWDDDFHHALHVALSGEHDGYYEDYRVGDLERAIEQGFVYTGQRSVHRGRRHGRPLVGVPRWRLIAYSQNHDQIGNRARGERLAHIAGVDRAYVAAALVLTSPFVPMLFMGEEWAASSPFQYFADHADPELAESVRQGRRDEFAAFGWRPEDVPDPCDRATFERSKLDWAELDDPVHGDLLEWYRALVRLRREHPELKGGTEPPRAVLVPEEGLLEEVRGSLVVVANLSDHKRRVDVDGEMLLASEGVHRRGRHLHLGPHSVAIVDEG